MAATAAAEVPLPTGTTGATLVIRPQLTAEHLQDPAVRREFKALVLEALEERDQRRRAAKRGITMQEAANNLGVGRTTLYRGMQKIPESELQKVRLKKRFLSPEFENLWRQHNR